MLDEQHEGRVQGVLRRRRRRDQRPGRQCNDRRRGQQQDVVAGSGHEQQQHEEGAGGHHAAAVREDLVRAIVAGRGVAPADAEPAGGAAERLCGAVDASEPFLQ